MAALIALVLVYGIVCSKNFAFVLLRFGILLLVTWGLVSLLLGVILNFSLTTEVLMILAVPVTVILLVVAWLPSKGGRKP